MRTWDQFYADVLPEAIGCPIPTVERSLLRAAQEFCASTGIWWQDLDAVTTSVGAQYFILPTGGRIVKIVGVTLNGQDIGIDTPNGTSAADRQRGTAGASRLQTVDLDSFTIQPTPADGLPVIVTAWLKPSDAAEGVPNHVGDNYAEALGAGALARILAMAGKEWSNPAAVAMKRAQFDRAIGAAKIAAWRGFSNNRPRARAMYF